jgi:hypothetical protein
MMKATIRFDIPGQCWVQRLSTRGDPVENRPFQALRIIRSCIGGAFLYLSTSQLPGRCRVKNITNEFTDMDDIFIGPFQ